MEDKTKFYIFDKKEIALIFVFMILASIITFILGVKFGLNYSYNSSGLTAEDRRVVELKSSTEEDVQDLQKKHMAKQINVDETYSQLKDEFDRLGEKDNSLKDSEPVEVLEDESPEKLHKIVEKVQVSENSEVNVLKSKDDMFYNKYTIQLGSYRSLDEAKEFAGGFKVRGYDPIVNQVSIPSKGGVWYRVSLGIFDTSSDAKKYITEHHSLFQSHNDYVIGKFD